MARIIEIAPPLPRPDRTLKLVVSAEPAEGDCYNLVGLLRDATELCRRLNVEAVKVIADNVTYYAHKDHVVKRTARNDYEVLREPFDAK